MSYYRAGRNHLFQAVESEDPLAVLQSRNSFQSSNIENDKCTSLHID